MYIKNSTIPDEYLVGTWLHELDSMSEGQRRATVETLIDQVEQFEPVYQDVGSERVFLELHEFQGYVVTARVRSLSPVNEPSALDEPHL